MKGLIKHNFYTVKGSLTTIFLLVAAMVFLSIFFGKNDFVMSATPLAAMGAFSGLSFTLLYNDNLSKWYNFELTTPITKKEVIACKYLTFLFFAIMGILAMILIITTTTLSSGVLDLERLGHNITFAIVFPTLIPAIMYPLILLLGIDKGQFIFYISIALTLFFYIIPSIVFTEILDTVKNPNIIYRVGIIIFSLLLFFVSYRFTCYQYNKMDLS